jgi:hypothetical protein
MSGVRENFKRRVAEDSQGFVAQALACGSWSEQDRPYRNKPRLKPAEKVQILSFRGRGLPEESVFFLGFAEKQIPRFARDDDKSYFFRDL